VCSDEFAWKSIIDGLTSLKMEASFQILTSVENKNRLDIALEGVAGKFKHDGEEVGTFEVERTIVAASSISDAMVTCTVVPDKWGALGLIADYYKDKLEFLVDISGSVRIKGIGFSIPINLTDILVKANKTVKKQDRHLCACPNGRIYTLLRLQYYLLRKQLVIRSLWRYRQRQIKLRLPSIS